MIRERLELLRQEMRKKKIDLYVVPTADFHESEYVGDYFKAREFITGFTGSAGVAVITLQEAGLWTDGRYFLQAAKQLEGTTVDLYRMGDEGVPTIYEFVDSKLAEAGVIGFDGRVVNTAMGLKLQKIASKYQGKLAIDEDLIGLIWKDRPNLSAKPAYILQEKYSGESVSSKMARVRREMEEQGTEVHVLTCLYDIAWLLNLRGDDIHCVPVVLSYLVLNADSCVFFVNPKVLNDEVNAYLCRNKIQVRDYEEIYDYVKEIKANKGILLSNTQVNYRIYENLPQGIKVVDAPSPCQKMKSIKNAIEIKNIVEAHRKDGVAMIKFMYWLKTNIGKKTITEISASDYLEDLRRQQKHFKDLSFSTISAYGAHGAMMHYSATEKTDAKLENHGLYLVDSGGHYLEGSTDITRTFVLGDLTDEERLNYTSVVRSNLNLASARFLYGCTGINLDILARGPIWDRNLDYKCGTGHGVGYMLNIHEGPNGFRWRTVPERQDSAILEEGNITTDEPGIYIEGKHGVRIENELLCKKGEKNEYGQFMYFEVLTFVPIDLDGIDPDEMTKTERQKLNEYHQLVYDKMSPFLEPEEAAWLAQYTRKI